MINRLYQLQRKYETMPGRNGQTVWENFATLTVDETMAGVYADRPLDKQSHISKKGAQDAWARKQHPELHERWKALPDDLKAARVEAMEYFRNKQNQQALYT